MSKVVLKAVVEIIVALGALACIFQWLEIKPKDLSMTALVSVPHILWLAFGLSLFAASLWSSLRAGYSQKQTIKHLQGELSKCDEDKKDYARRNLQYRAQLDTPPWAGYESEQQWQESIALQNRLIELGRSVDGVLDSLQLEALAYAKQLGELLDDAAKSYPSRENLNKMPQPEAFARIEEISEWRHTLESKYKLEFAGREETLMSKFGVRGIKVTYVATTRGFQPIEQKLTDTIASIISAVHRVDGVSVSARAAE